MDRVVDGRSTEECRLLAQGISGDAGAVPVRIWMRLPGGGAGWCELSLTSSSMGKAEITRLSSG